MQWSEDDKHDLEYYCLCALQRFVGRAITPELKSEIAAQIARTQWQWFAEKLHEDR